MASAPDNEETGFTAEVNEQPENDQGAEDRLKNESLSKDEKSKALNKAQEEAAEERRGGGYQ